MKLQLKTILKKLILEINMVNLCNLSAVTTRQYLMFLSFLYTFKISNDLPLKHKGFA